VLILFVLLCGGPVFAAVSLPDIPGYTAEALRSTPLSAPSGDFGVWLPPNMPHIGFNRREVLQASLYVVDELCQGLPPWPQALLVTSFMRALLNQASTDARDFGSEEHQRLLRTLLGELKAAPVTGTFLPASDDPVLGPLLNHLEENPQDSRCVSELAREAGITERTLARKCHQDLKIPQTEWHNRMRIVKAMTLLEARRTVEPCRQGVRIFQLFGFFRHVQEIDGHNISLFRIPS